MSKERLVYVNEKQDAFFEAQQQIKVFVGGRGSGKSTVLGDETYECLLTMPRSKGFLASVNETTIKNFSLPSILERLEALGEEEGEDYVVGKRPPSWFERPYNPPSRYRNVISFSNGTALEILSMYGKNAGRGGNYNWGFFDEAALIDKETHDKSVLGAMRGNRDKIGRIPVDPDFIAPYGEVKFEQGQTWWVIPFKDNPRYRMRAYVTSMPWTTDGQWILEMQDDPRAFYIESTALDNIEVLGEEYINDLRQTLPPHVFAVEVMNKRVNKVPNAFYYEFDDTKHTTVSNLYNSNDGIDVSFDFNAGFNSMIICQGNDKRAYVHDEIYVKGNQIVEDLVDSFINKYQFHLKKEITIYGDRNGNSRFSNSRETIYEMICRKLRDAGWSYYQPEKGLDAPHKDKHELENKALKEDPADKMPPIRINRINCKGLILSISNAPMTGDFKKDKSSEVRLRKSEYREEATDLSDCFDNWYFFKYKHLYSYLSTYGASPGLGMGGI